MRQQSEFEPDSDEVASSEESSKETEAEFPEPPVSEGETRQVTIKSLGKQGDGIAKVERRYVVIVPDGAPGDEPTVKITERRAM